MQNVRPRSYSGLFYVRDVFYIKPNLTMFGHNNYKGKSVQTVKSDSLSQKKLELLCYYPAEFVNSATADQTLLHAWIQTYSAQLV